MDAFRSLLFSCLALTLLAGCLTRPAQVTASAAQPDPGEYVLGIGDVISIRVFGGEEDLRFERVRLNDRGALTLPFGDVVAHGRTTRQVEADITQNVKGKFLLKPRVWVNIEEYRPFFMQGQVTRPGAYPYQPGMTVSRAIIIAGGFRERAAKDRIFIVPEGDKPNRPIRVDSNTPVRPGDTVNVEESFF